MRSAPAFGSPVLAPSQGMTCSMFAGAEVPYVVVGETVAVVRRDEHGGEVGQTRPVHVVAPHHVAGRVG